MKFLEARNQHRDTDTPLQMYGRAPLFHIHRAYIIYGATSGRWVLISARDQISAT